MKLYLGFNLLNEIKIERDNDIGRAEYGGTHRRKIH